MARRPTKPDALVKAPLEAQIIAEGDFAGMTYDAVLEGIHAGLEEVLGPLSIEGALAAQDRLLKQSLEIALHYKGAGYTQEAALRFGQTIVGYLQVPEINAEKAYGELAKARARLE